MPHWSCWLEQLVTNLASKAVLLFIAYVFPVALLLYDNHCAQHLQPWYCNCTCKSCISRKSKTQTNSKQMASLQLFLAPLAYLHTDVAWVQDMDVPAAIKDADSTREAQLLESWKAYKKGFQEGVALFNKKPKKGIAFMQVCCQVCCLILSCKLQAITFSIPQLGKLLMFPILFPQTCYSVKSV